MSADLSPYWHNQGVVTEQARKGMRNWRPWRVGLHIQSKGLYAIALSGSISRPILKGYWYFPLDLSFSEATGLVWSDPSLRASLRSLARQLPHHYSLRVGLAPNQVLQHRLPAPVPLLRPALLKEYFNAVVNKLLPEAVNTFCFDYRRSEQEVDCYTLTIARLSNLSIINNLFKQCRLVADIIELQTTALALLLNQQPAKESYLLYQGDDFWLWSARQSQSWQQGWSYRSNFRTATEVIAQQDYTYPVNYLANSDDLPLPEGFIHYPFPDFFTKNFFEDRPDYSRFMIAAGLAIRSKDIECC